MGFAKIISCLFLLFHSSKAGDTVFNNTYHAPNTLLENQCGAAQLRSKGPVYIYFTYFNYCRMRPNEKEDMENYLASFRMLGESLVRKAATEFLWDVTLFFQVPTGEECTLPEKYAASIQRNGTNSKNNGKPSAIQINLLMPYPTGPSAFSVARTAVQQIDAQLSVTGAVGMATISVMGPYTTYVKILLDREYQHQLYPFFQFDSIDDAVKTNLMHLLSAVGCNPSYIGAVPYTRYDALSNTSQCECICPQGEAFVDESATVKVCKAKENFDQSGKCNWLAKCYAVTLKQSSTHSYDGACSLRGYFGSGVAKIPAPWDNYVSETQNIFAKGAKIVVSATDPNGKLKRLEYEWITFQGNGNAIMDRDFPFEIVGVHQLQIEAHDYHEDTICNTEIKITDDVLPTVLPSVSCPTPDKDGNSWKNYQQGIDDALKVGAQYEGYVAARINDPCGNGDECDVDSRKVQNLGAHSSVSSSGTPSWILNSDDRLTLYGISDSILSNIPGYPMHKCWNLQSHFGEKVTSYTCNNVESETCKKALSSCSLMQCLKASGWQMYNSRIKLNANVQQRTEKIAAMLEVSNFNKYLEIHEAIPESVVGTDPGEGTFTNFLSNMIDIDLVIRAFAKLSTVQFDNLGSGKDINDIIKTRYQVNNGEWKLWELGTDTNEVEFIQESNTLIIESWSALGRVGRKEFSVILHPHSKLDMCTEFQRSSFYQSLSSSRSNNEHQYCSYPESNFAEITFDFSHDVGLLPLDGSQLPYHFKNITCSAYYLAENSNGGNPRRISTGAQLFQYTGAKLRFVERYGIDLKSGPTDVNTPIEINCRLWYMSEESKAVEQHCKQTLTFDDCEAPRFPSESQSSKFKLCTDSCQDKVQPFGFCGDNHLQYIPNTESIASLGQAKFTRSSILENSCCTDCGDYQCTDLVEPHLNTSLKSCQLQSKPTTTTLSLFAHQQTQSILVSSILFIVVIAMTVIINRRSQQQTYTVQDQDTYTPLL